MAYGTVKVDNITFTNGGIDQTVTVSGIVQSISGNITATGTIQAATIIGTSTVSGATVTGDAGVFTTVTGGSAGFTTVTGTTVTGTTANFATLSGTTITGSVGNFGSGSASAPSVSVGTTDNGIYSPGADQVAISTNGTGRLFVDSNGNVGIGVSSVVNVANRSQLVIGGTSGGLIDLSYDTTATEGRIFVNDGEFLLRAAQADGQLIFQTGGATERLRITSDGKVGLGTSAPGSALDLGPGTQGRAISWHTSSTAAQGAIWTSFSSADLTLARNLIGSTSASAFLSSNSNNVGKAAVQLTAGSFVVYTDPASTVAYGTAFTPTPRLTIDSSGRVGVGTTSPAGTGVDIGGAGASAASFVANPKLGIAGDIFFDPGSGNDVEIFNYRTTGMAFGVGGVEKARIDSSGRLLVGTSTSRAVGGTAAADFQVEVAGSKRVASFVRNGGSPILSLGTTGVQSIGDVTLVSNGDILGQLEFAGADGTDLQSLGATITALVDGTPGANDMPGRLVFSTTADGASSPTERMSIGNAGAIFIGSTARTQSGFIQGASEGLKSYAASTTGTCRIECFHGGSTTVYHQVFSNANGIVGSISTAASATAYNTSSDYRLKENVTAVTDGITRLQQLKPSRFNFIADPDTTVDGFIAHEVQTIVPEAITGEKDAVDDEGNPIYQGIDQSKMVPLVVAALQECIKKVEALEAEVASLKAGA